MNSCSSTKKISYENYQNYEVYEALPEGKALLGLPLLLLPADYEWVEVCNAKVKRS